MKKNIALVLAATCAVFYTTSAEAVSLKESLEATYGGNPRLEAERERVKATNELSSQAFSGWLPTVTATYTAADESRKVGNSAEIDDTSDRRQLTLSQPVFNGGATVASMSQAEKQAFAAKAAFHRVEQEVLFDTIVAYMNVVREREEVRLNTNNESVLRKHLLVTKERFNLGEVTRTDVAQAEARLSLASSERARADGRLQIARAEFKRLTGVEEDGASIEYLPEGLPANVDELIDVALKSNPSVLEAFYNEAAAEDAIKINRASLLPSVTINGNIRREEGTSFSGSNEFEEENIGFTLSVPLYQSGAEYSRVRQSKYNAQRLANDKKEVENSIVEFSIRVWQEYDVAKTTIESTDDAVKAAQIALEGVIHEAQVGSRTTLDVLDAEQELFRAKVDMVRAQRNEIVAAYNIKAVMGALTAANMGLDVTLFDSDKHYDSVKYKFIGF